MIAPNADTYWHNKGKHQELMNRLRQLIPANGRIVNPRANPYLEKFRKAANAYGDLHNNGLWNRARSFSRLFNVRVSDYRKKSDYKTRYKIPKPKLYKIAESKMDAIILAAAREQGIA